MNHFQLQPEMRATFGGAFYPSGYSMIMFPDAGHAAAVSKQLVDAGKLAGDIFLVPPPTLLAQITPTVVDADDPLPSAGTEGATVRAYTKLAREGHTGLLVRTEDAESAEQLMTFVREVPYSIAQRYRALVIEDL